MRKIRERERKATCLHQQEEIERRADNVSLKEDCALPDNVIQDPKKAALRPPFLNCNRSFNFSLFYDNICENIREEDWLSGPKHIHFK